MGLRSLLVTNMAPWQALAVLWDCLPEDSPNPASFDKFPVETLLAAFVIVRGPYHAPA